jgi:hypothetical protein
MEEEMASKADTQTLMATLAALCEKAIDEKRHHDVLVISVLGYLESYARKDKDSADAALGLIFRTADRLLQSSPLKHECSFCARSPPKVRLIGGAGHKAYICNNCVDMLHADLHGSGGKKD